VNGTGTVSSSTSITPASKPATSPTTSLHYPTQSGITATCNKYAEAVAGDYCYIFAQNHNITTDQLYAWNAILRPNGANCSTEFQAGTDYCVSVDPHAELFMRGCKAARADVIHLDWSLQCSHHEQPSRIFDIIQDDVQVHDASGANSEWSLLQVHQDCRRPGRRLLLQLCARE